MENETALRKIKIWPLIIMLLKTVFISNISVFLKSFGMSALASFNNPVLVRKFTYQLNTIFPKDHRLGYFEEGENLLYI